MNATKTERRNVAADWFEEHGQIDIAEATRAGLALGEIYLFTTALYAWCGRVQAVSEKEVLLNPACRVFDTGRYGNALSGGLEAQGDSQLEPAVGEVVLFRTALVDAAAYPHEVPTQQK